MSIDVLFIILRVVIVCAVFACFVFQILKSRCRYSIRTTICMLGGLMCATAFIIVVFLTSDALLSEYSTLGIILWLAIALGAIGFFIRISIPELLFLVLVILNLYVNIIAIAKIIAYELNLNISLNITWTVVSVLVTIIYIPLLWLLFVKLYGQVLKLNINSFFWKFLWMIPALTYMIFYVKIIEDYWKNPTFVTSHDVLFSILWSLTTYAFFGVALQMLIQAYKGISAREELGLIMSQLRMQERQYRNLLETNAKTERFQHDLRHHFLLISGFLENEEMDKLKDYLKPLLTQYGSEKQASVCQNHVVDVILQHYAGRAMECGVNLKIKADIPEDIAIRDTDLCITFGNLMENAVEACVQQNLKDASLTVKAEMRSGQMTAMIRNTYANKVIVHDECYFSTKHDGKGVGLSSVKKVAEAYDGDMKVEYDGQYFTVFILLNQKQLKNERKFNEGLPTETHR